MDGHIDAVSCMAKNPNHLKGIFSGSMDGGASPTIYFTDVKLDFFFFFLKQRITN